MFYDRENLIYFAGGDDLEGGALAVPDFVVSDIAARCHLPRGVRKNQGVCC